ncbi:hypothetical protein [Pelagibacterium luteolum]|uniref:HdeA/HdeB family protein n=1 Tax=Pelagibacterium luteolum TaxID=440168 RepID=A0A1G7Y567_9HYPH|nr:hypothetical protein [Pelagibacterium luteolum]SDG91618.1 hypothetical protein SAMN04487974_11262 [Pelagibacterium luteolum]
MMRVLLGLAIGMAGLGIHPAAAQGLSEIDAINRCEAFVEESLRPEIGAAFKSSYKMVCYFGLIDPEIQAATELVCDRVASALGPAHRIIASFACHGTYELYRREAAGAQ